MLVNLHYILLFYYINHKSQYILEISFILSSISSGKGHIMKLYLQLDNNTQICILKCFWNYFSLKIGMNDILVILWHNWKILNLFNNFISLCKQCDMKSSNSNLRLQPSFTKKNVRGQVWQVLMPLHILSTPFKNDCAKSKLSYTYHISFNQISMMSYWQYNQL